MTMKLMYSPKNEIYVFTENGKTVKVEGPGYHYEYPNKKAAIAAAERAGFHVDRVTGVVHTTSESERATDYRGFKIERDSGRGGYLLHYPEGEGNPKSVKTLKAAKAYIDTYMGDSGTEGLGEAHQINVFSASPRSGKYAIEAWLLPDGSFRYERFTSGKNSGGGFGYGDKDLIRRKLVAMIRSYKKYDGIDYRITHDEIGARELLKRFIDNEGEGE